MAKSPEAFRTISEVAEWLDVPTHVLRFWESRFAQVKPVKRAGGRRYYRPSDMELLGGIKRLLHDDGLTIRGVQKLLREEGIRHVAALSPPLREGGPAASDSVNTADPGGSPKQLATAQSETATSRSEKSVDSPSVPLSTDDPDDFQAFKTLEPSEAEPAVEHPTRSHPANEETVPSQAAGHVGTEAPLEREEAPTAVGPESTNELDPLSGNSIRSSSETEHHRSAQLGTVDEDAIYFTGPLPISDLTGAGINRPLSRANDIQRAMERAQSLKLSLDRSDV